VTRYKLTLEYDGGGFAGWQRQDNGPSVQAALEAAVLGFCGETVTVQGAGRTDAGVHALGQVAHLDLAKETDADTVRDALNAHLKPAAVAVLAAEAVAGDFHARFSALERGYRYRIVNRRAPLALDRGRAWFVPQPLDAAAMHDAAQALLGNHDFTSFRASECQRLHQLPGQRVPGQVAGQDPRRPGRDPRRPGAPHRGPGALLPAPSGAQHGRHPQAGRRRQVAPCRCNPRARSPRPQRGGADGAGGGALSRGGAILIQHLGGPGGGICPS
jgi:tRNA pseudouridine(38-40) synthase